MMELHHGTWNWFLNYATYMCLFHSVYVHHTSNFYSFYSTDMLAKIRLTADQMEEVTALIRSVEGWELDEVSLTEEIEQQVYYWTIRCTNEQMIAIYHTIDIGADDYVTEAEDIDHRDGGQGAAENAPLDDGVQQEVQPVGDNVIQFRVTPEQAQALRDFARERGINEFQAQLNAPEQHCVVIRPPDPDRDECEQCLCRPCVLHENNRQAWWPEVDLEAAHNNNTLRKPLYYKFWTMLYHRGVWDDQRYRDRKEQALGRRDTTLIRREMIPLCVVDRIRKWYPNPPGLPYMGHRWI